jgi:hypothetical protein
MKVKKEKKEVTGFKLAQSRKISYLELTTCGTLAIFLCQKSMAYNRSTMVMGGVF